MSDEEDNNWMSEDTAEQKEEHVRSAPKPKEEPKTEEKTEAQRIIEEKQRKHEAEEMENMVELEAQRKAQREKEDQELEKLKQKQAQRKKEREEEERRMEEQKKQQEEQRRVEAEQLKVKQEEERRRKQEEAERKKAVAQAAGAGGRNFVISKSSTEEGGGSTLDKFMSISKAQTEMSLNANELEALKRRTVTDRVKTLSVADMGKAELKAKAEELWKQIISIETGKYDLTMRQERQDYDLKELNERQRQINKNKYVKMGVDPEAASGRFPPKVQLISKYERRTDRRSYEDRKMLFDRSKEEEKKEFVRPKAVKRENWIKDKVEESKRGATYEEEEETSYTRPSADDDEGFSRPSNTYSSHKEEEEVEAEEE